LQHAPVVHLVNVIAGEDEHVLGLLGTDGINVLIDRVRRAHIPVIADPLHRGENFNELSYLAADDIPTFTDVPVERKSFVLGKDEDAAQFGVNAIGKRDIDDAVDAAEGDGRFGAIASERIESLAGASC